MTTIAYDMEVGQVAADSQETDGCSKNLCRKLYRVGEFIVATAGGSYSGLAFVEWLDQWEGDPDWDERPDVMIHLDTEEDFECLVVRKDKSCYLVNRLFIPNEQIGNRYITLGSGGTVAQGALRMGATPERAVQIASEVDTYTGGPVVVMTV